MSCSWLKTTPPIQTKKRPTHPPKNHLTNPLRSYLVSGIYRGLDHVAWDETELVESVQDLFGGAADVDLHGNPSLLHSEA